ncbi:MAG: heparinase II/III family protein [Candidatus Sumerlaeota bacterium]|nr:heparinase II/III family protein [Candidatus Sumerlaeota bacterium]
MTLQQFFRHCILCLALLSWPLAVQPLAAQKETAKNSSPTQAKDSKPPAAKAGKPANNPANDAIAPDAAKGFGTSAAKDAASPKATNPFDASGAPTAASLVPTVIPNELPPHPRLLLNSEGVAQLKQRIAACSWAKSQWERIKSKTDQALSQTVELPPRGGNWSHNYVCSEHGARLSLGKKIAPWEWEHKCPIGPHILHGDTSKGSLDFNGNAISSAHADLAQQIVDAGILFQATGDTRYAARGRAILLAYTDRYLAYPLHDNQGRLGKGGGHVASQSLTEASWIIITAQGADLVWDTLSADERQRVADKMLLPAVNEIILPRKVGIHNIQCRHNSAIGLVGFLLGDKKLISFAIDDKAVGYRRQMEAGVMPDGMWLEGSSGYHFFTIEGLWPLTEAARNCGINLYGEKFKAMFDAPFTFIMPNLVLPDFNDSGMVSLQGHAALYELAFARYQNPLYASLLSRSDRKDERAMLFGVLNLPQGNLLNLKSRNSEASGYAILQRGQDQDATWLCVKYGPHGGGHGHPDKNQFVLYTHGQVLAPDGGTHAYGSPLHKSWDKATVAHNTLVVDQMSQTPAQGKSLAFGSENGVDYSVTDAGAIYKDARFIRTTAMLTPDLVLVIDQIHCDAPHTLDIAYHQFGAWEGLPAGQPWTAPGATDGYRYLKDATSLRAVSDGIVLKINAGGSRTAITLASGCDDPTEIIAGYAIYKTTQDRVPMLLMRRTAKNTAFVWAISLAGQPVTLKMSAVSGAISSNNAAPTANAANASRLPIDEAVLVQVSDGKRQWQILANPAKRAISAAFPDGAVWRGDEIIKIK